MIRDSEYVRAYASRYREIFPVRIASILAIIVLTTWLQGWAWGLNYAVCQLGLYAVFWIVVERARLRPEVPGAGQALKRWTEGVTLVLAIHCSLFALAAATVRPDHIFHAILLLCGHLIVGALQVHISRLSFAVSVTPPALTIAWLAWLAAGSNIGLMACAATLTAGVLGAAWRQMVSDRQAVELQVDLTERTAALETALTQAETDRAQAERANMAKSRFLAMISHDVRTPLNIIMGVVEVLKRKKRPAAETELVADMGDAGSMLLRLLNGALDLSKIESGQSEVALAPVDVRAGLESVGRVWRHRAEELNLDLVVDCDGAPADFHVLADEGRIEQVVINLLSNALKMTPAGTVRLHARARPAGDGVVALDIEVHDQGPGVPEDQRARIFEPFEQLDAGRAAGGAGLGLAICRSSVEAMGGTLGVREAEGGGAVFWFRITADRSEPAAAPAPAPAPTPTPTPAKRSGALSVLAAEDHPANRKLLAMLLESLNVDLAFAENGAEAVALASQNAYDLILMDVMMPVMDGVAALQAIRATGNAVPIHMLTANVFDDDVARYMAAGADGVLGKPFKVAALHALIAETSAPPMRMAG
ncbi:response regulator [Brevundimonas staleyi]|uniref:histidine kinase n=1 Tax=Brevundimonas staleyi TaxID=74326 RepID=A0ABW0FSC9_9CAUL